MEQEQKEIQLEVQFAIYLETDYKEMCSIEDFQPGLQQEHLHNEKPNKISSQCAFVQKHTRLIIEHPHNMEKKKKYKV